ncbi:MAG: hypothetical protein FWH34_02765 [Desulfovibrionaceae bacterium]|nr:hypothetical protein [Desulfovibrionaceae bacterium]
MSLLEDTEDRRSISRRLFDRRLFCERMRDGFTGEDRRSPSGDRRRQDRRSGERHTEFADELLAALS